MSLVDLRRSVRDERGVALPLAMMALVLLSGITVAFVAMAGMEPFIADNHRASNQALNLAEAGLERAIWALSNSAAPGLPDPRLPELWPAAPYTAPAPYDESTLAALGVGGYSVLACVPDSAGCTPAPGPTGSSRDWNVTATGYVMRGDTALPAAPGGVTDANRVALKTISATLVWVGPPNTPGALTVAGSVDLGGNTSIDGNSKGPGAPNSCPMKNGVTVRDKTTDPGPDGQLGTADDGTSIGNTLTGANQGSVTVDGTVNGDPTKDTETVAEKTFNEKYLFNRDQLETLREYAKTKGTYIKPTSNDQFILDVQDGLMFVDTVGGVPLGNPPDASTLANVKVTGAANSGWLVVMGSLTLDGNITYNGLIYSVNDLQYRGTGTGSIHGSVVSANIIDTKSTTVDTQAQGNAQIYYDCEAVKNGGGKFKPPEGYFVRSGTWRECDPTRAQGTPGACS